MREKRNGKKGKGAFVLIRAHGVEVLRFQRIFSNRVCLRHDLLAGRIPTRWTKGNYEVPLLLHMYNTHLCWPAMRAGRPLLLIFPY